MVLGDCFAIFNWCTAKAGPGTNGLVRFGSINNNVYNCNLVCITPKKEKIKKLILLYEKHD